MTRATIRNWEGAQTWRPEAIHHPRDEQEVAALVQRAAETGKRVKAVGGALSWSDIIDVPEVAIRFDRMSRVLSVDRDRRLIRVQPGARLRDVNEVLALHGLAFDNFGSIVKQTTAGYLGTGTHGTGGRTQILSTQVAQMRLVDGKGEVHVLDAEHEPELFSAARVHLGCLGVVTEVTLGCVEAFDLEERLELVDFDRALADLDATVDKNDYCKLWWLAYTRQAQVYTFNRTTKRRTRGGLMGLLDRSGVSGAVFGALMAASRTFPASTRFIHDRVQRLAFQPHVRVDRSDRIIRYSGSIPIHQETEYSIPRAQAAKAIDEVRRSILAADYRVNFPLEVRFVAADDIPMSHAHGRDSCYVGGYIANAKQAPRYFRDFEELMGAHEGRPHWGKTFSRTGLELRALYSGYDAFNRLRKRCDPRGVFRNSFVDRVFPPQQG